jgi:hypothetical protein
MHNTDGRRGDAVAYQLATHDIGTIGCRLGCLTSFIVAASSLSDLTRLGGAV